METIDAYVKLYLRCNGTDGSTTFLDGNISRYTITAQGDAQLDTSEKKYGTASGLFDGSGDYLIVPHSADWYFDSSATISCFIRYTALPASGNTMVLVYQQTDANNLWMIGLYNDSGTYKWQFLLRKSGVDVINMLRSTSLSVDTWYHLEWDKSGSNFYFFQDGTLVGSSLSDANTFADLTGDLYICADASGANASNCRIDEFMIAKGIARHTSNFTPPTDEWAFDDTFTDGVGVNDTYDLLSIYEFSDDVGADDTYDLLNIYEFTDDINVNDTIELLDNIKNISEESALNDGWGLTIPDNAYRNRKKVDLLGKRLSFKIRNNDTDSGLFLLDIITYLAMYNGRNDICKINATGDKLTLKIGNSTVDETITLEDMILYLIIYRR